MTSGPLIYLVSPYNHNDPRVREHRFDQVCLCASRLMNKGHFIFSPIAHTHPIAAYGLPKGWEFWERYDTAIIERVDEVWVLMIDGWEASTGVSAEICMAVRLGKPVWMVDPGTLNIVKELT